MRFVDINNNTIENPDLSMGYLVSDKIVIAHHEAIPEVPGFDGIGHYETVKEYPNGGKDVKLVWDMPPIEAVPAKDAWDEYEDVQRYIEYTKEELNEIKNRPTIDSLTTDITNIQIAVTELYEIIMANSFSEGDK